MITNDQRDEYSTLAPVTSLRILLILDFDIHFHLLTTETRRAQREFSCPIGRRRSGKRSQPFGQDLVHRLLDVNGWRQAKELSPKAEALFPGRRLPAREKSPSSVSSVPLWFIFNQASSGRHNEEVSDYAGKHLLSLRRLDQRGSNNGYQNTDLGDS